MKRAVRALQAASLEHIGPGELSRQEEWFALLMCPHRTWTGAIPAPCPAPSPSVTGMEVTQNWETPDERERKVKSAVCNSFGRLLSFNV